MSASNNQTRAVPRYIAQPPLEARFGDASVTLLNLSVGGAMLLHPEPLSIGSEAALRLQISSETLDLYGEVMWSRPHRSSGEFLSGLRFTEWIEVAQHAIDVLLRSGVVRLDSSAPPTRLDGIP